MEQRFIQRAHLFRGIAARRASTKRLAELNRRRKLPGDPAYRARFGRRQLVELLGSPATIEMTGTAVDRRWWIQRRLDINDLNVVRPPSQLGPRTQNNEEGPSVCEKQRRTGLRAREQRAGRPNSVQRVCLSGADELTHAKLRTCVSAASAFVTCAWKPSSDQPGGRCRWPKGSSPRPAASLENAAVNSRQPPTIARPLCN